MEDRDGKELVKSREKEKERKTNRERVEFAKEGCETGSREKERKRNKRKKQQERVEAG